MKLTLTLLVIVNFGLLTVVVNASGSVVIGIDPQTGTRFSIVDQDNYTRLCLQEGLGRIGTLKVIGEVPQSVSLSDDSVARSILRKSKQVIRETCPKFKLHWVYNDLQIRLFYEPYRDWDRNAIIVSVNKITDKGEVTENYDNRATVAQNETIFRLESCDKRSGIVHYRRVKGYVPPGVDLSIDATARKILKQAEEFGIRECGPPSGPFDIELYQRNQLVVKDPPYWNGPVENRLAAERVKREAEERARREAQQRAEQARQAKEKADKAAAQQRNWNDFLRKYGVQELVESPSLFANPFLYQGKTLAVSLSFERMMTASSAIFQGGNSIFVVSNIPTETYKSKTERDLLAVRVIGMTEIKGLPMISSMQVPNLRFVGVHFCQDWSCSDILAQR